MPRTPTPPIVPPIIAPIGLAVADPLEMEGDVSVLLPPPPPLLGLRMVLISSRTNGCAALAAVTVTVRV